MMTSSSGTASFTPCLKVVKSIALYETKTRFFLVGSNTDQSAFRVLKIDRVENRKLEISDDRTLYSAREIRGLLQMIDVGNRSKIGQKVGSGVCRTVSAFGILGFVRFLEGYYIIFITKRRKVANIGFHEIFKVEETQMVYIPSDNKEMHQDEQRYARMFQAADLSSNFYYSYSYDISHSLQYNLSDPKILLQPTTSTTVKLEDVPNLSSGHYSFVPEYQPKFVWNEYLLQGLEHIDPAWFLPIIHGFVDQANVSIYGRAVHVTLIARRSNRYAGTRFLKRGANLEGDVANEVETEQIVCDGSIGSDKAGHYTSFVQMRGSVPAQWSQDISKIQPKPPIFIEIQEPFGVTAGKHFNELLGRYGSPVVVINLVKKRETRRHETLLSEEFTKQISYLNQFLPDKHRIQYIHFDMARCNKSKKADVMARLEGIAYKAVKRTGIFHNRPTLHLHLQESWADPHVRDLVSVCRGKSTNMLHYPLQTGIVRTNCVDCLDRTNTAQFVVGKCALAFQLHALGVLEAPRLKYDTDCVRILEEMYEDHGDTLALQYGGSALVHRIKTYRKTAAWTSRGNDIMQTMRRYYSNTLSDAEKQHTMNVFLGIFQPEAGKPAIWEKEFNSDYYLHHQPGCGRPIPLTQWWSPELLAHLPLPLSHANKACRELIKVSNPSAIRENYYRAFEMTSLGDFFPFSEVHHSVRDQMPNFTTDFSPFSVRVRMGKKREEMSGKQTNLSIKNPSVAGNSTSSTTSTEDDSPDVSETESSDTELGGGSEPGGSRSSGGEDAGSEQVTFTSLFPSMEAVYGVKVHTPAKADLQLYKTFSSLSRQSGPLNDKVISSSAVLHPLARPIDRLTVCPIPVHDYSSVLFPTIPPKSRQIYEEHVQVGNCGSHVPSAENLAVYTRYVEMLRPGV